jgi:hypothetical protein
MMKSGRDAGGGSSTVRTDIDPEVRDDKGVNHEVNMDNLHEDSKDWAVEVYKVPSKGKAPIGEQEDKLEIQLNEEDAVETSKVLGIAVFYSKKSYNLHFLFSDMINVWGLQNGRETWRLYVQDRVYVGGGKRCE